MDPSPSTSQDESAPSTSTEGDLSFMTIHDVTAFGVSSELSGLNLPTKLDILKYYFHLAERAGNRSRMFSYKTFTPHVTDELIHIWQKVEVPILQRRSIINKLNRFLDTYRTKDRNKTQQPTIFATFVESTKEIFYIGQCQCNLKAAQCSCGSIPAQFKEFMHDQFNDRKLTIQEYVTEIEDQVPVSMTMTMPSIEDSSDETYEPPQEGMDTGDEEASSSNVREMIRGPYSERYDLSNYSSMCDRFGISDRVASALGTALLADFNAKDKQGNPVIIDKSKMIREKAKCRREMLRKQYDASSLIAFSFDGRKDESLTREKIDKSFHYRMEREPHLVILKEPHSQFLGHTRCEREDSETKFNDLITFFTKKEICLDALIGISCDGEPTNTGILNGIIRRFERHLKRPLHWFVCLLHFNELPFRHLFNTLEHSSTTGPRSATSQLSKDIATCENRTVCNCYKFFRNHFQSNFSIIML